MKTITTLFCLCALTVVASAAAPEKGSTVEKVKQQWNVALDPSLPNVLLIGDSISMGYTHDTRALLKGKANVIRPNENCSGTTKGAQAVDRSIAGHKWAVIHFNFGLHDLKHVSAPGGDKVSAKPEDPPQATAEKYAENLEVIVKKLKATGARLVFATTTPVPEGCTNPFRAPADVPRYNAAALKIMKANGVAIDDLFAFCEPQLAKLQRPKNVHFTDVGSKALAEQVAKSIEGELKK